MRQGAGGGVTASLFPFLDRLEEAEGEHLEQRGRYHPAAQVPPLMAESQVPGVNTGQRQQYGAPWALSTTAMPLQGVRDVGWMPWSSSVAPVETLGTQISFCRCMASSGPPKKAGHPSHLVPAHAAVGSFSRPDAITQIFH